MKTSPELDFYSQPLFWRVNSCSFSVPHSTVLKACLPCPALLTQHLEHDLPSIQSSEALAPTLEIPEPL